MLSQKNLLFCLISCLVIFFACQGPAPKSTLSTEQQAEYLSKGKKITTFSFKAFSSELIKSIEAGGIGHAVDYCNLKAIPLTDSLSRTYNADIKRVSNKYRNPGNKPDEMDMKVITAYRQQMGNDQELQPHLEVIGDTVIYYAPIIILNPVCLQCHGEPGNTTDPAIDNLIKLKYPQDKATGYKLGDLRGVWKIIFNV